MSTQTSRLALPYPQPTDPDDVPTYMGDLADALDVIIIKWQTGTLANRPAAGNAGFGWFATDQTGADGNLGQWYLDTGTQWILVNPQASLASSVTASAVGDVGVVGTSTAAARQDHKHARESFAGSGGNYGSAGSPARSDHAHPTGVLQAYPSVSQNFTNAASAIVTFNTTSIDDYASLSDWNDATYTYTAPYTGRYRVNAQVSLTGTTGTAVIYVEQNGTHKAFGPPAAPIQDPSAATSLIRCTLDRVLACNAGDTLAIYCLWYSGSGSIPLDVDATRTYLEITAVH